MSKKLGHNPKTEELYTVKQDCNEGVSRGHSTMNMTRIALGHPMVRWKNRRTGEVLVIECDVYAVGGELMVHLFCPKCRHNLQIKSSNKQLSYDKERDVLDVEPFSCTWEMNDELLGEKRDFGMSLCKWTVGIDNNLAKEA